MKIAIISLMGGSAWGGSEVLWHAFAMYALQQGDEVYVSVYDWGKVHLKIEQLQLAGATVHHRKKFNPSAGIIEKISRFVQNRAPSINKDYQSIIDFKPGFVFISQGDSFDLAIHHRPLYNLIKKNRIPFSIVCHNHSQYGWIPETSVFPGAVEIFYKAKQAYFISQRQWQLTERRLACKLTNGQFTWNPLNIKIPGQPLAWPEETVIKMTMVAALEGGKGQDTALEVLSKPEWKNRNWHLNLYGRGEGENYLKHLAEFYGIRERISFNGYVSDIASVWQANHILLIPSAGEGLPISLVEAMVCGRPAIVTDVGGNAELVVEGETGFISPSPTTESFAHAMEKAWLRKSSWQQLGKNAYESTIARLDRNPEKKIYESLKTLK